MKRSQFLPLIILIFVISILFRPFIIEGRLPVPSDTIIGLYNPYRDLYAKDYPNGIPFKNFLITDPVRQQYPWRWLTLNLEKNFMPPLWNPYNMAGYPLLGNQQSAAFYPLNILLFLFPFSIGWSILILLQPLLAALFMYYYLQNLKLQKLASILGSFVFAMCGFMIAWLEWGTIGHVAIWLPMILLSIDKMFLSLRAMLQSHKAKQSHGNKIYPIGIASSHISWSAPRNDVIIWSFIFTFSICAAFLAGHLQTFFYVYAVSLVYLFFRWLQFGRSLKILIIFIILNACFLILTSVQWLSLFQLITLSARNIDQNNWHQEGWFIPWQHLIQFIAPDFFGNPTTLNYWGVWNYGEMIGYVGILPLLFAFYALLFRKDKKIVLFGSIFLISLIFSLPTVFAEIPFIMQLPFLSIAQPTRLLFLTDFSSATLAALGLDYYLRSRYKKQLLVPIILITIIFISLWIFILYGYHINPKITLQNIVTAKHNLYFPTLIFVIVSLGLLISIYFNNKKSTKIVYVILIIITIVDLLRFAQKFTPFTNEAYLFPQTAALSYLQKQTGQFRIMATDSRIFPPNFSIMYHLQSLDGYDPLYLQRYGELIAALGRNKPDIHPPFGFNRIITPQTTDSRLIDLLGVQYVLSFSDINQPKFKKVFVEGQTKVYKNENAFNRAFFVNSIKPVTNKNDAILALFDKTIDLKNTAIVENPNFKSNIFSKGLVNIRSYTENRITIDTDSEDQAYLVLMDTFYPIWHASICSPYGLNCQETKIYLTNYNFRGIVVPKGKHQVIYYNILL